MTIALQALFLKFGLVLIRVSACIIVMPVLGNLPAAQVRATIIFILSLMLTYTLTEQSVELPEGILPLVYVGLGEVIMGVGIGFCARLILLAGEFAGQLIGVPMGMGFMQIVDPLSGNNLNVISRFFITITVMIFFIIGGHHTVIYGLTASFRAWPLGHGLPSGAIGLYFNRLTATMLATGISLSAPVVISILAVKVGLGIISRSAPKIQVFFIGFALAILIGLLVLVTTMPEMVNKLSSLTLSLHDWLPRFFEEAQSAR